MKKYLFFVLFGFTMIVMFLAFAAGIMLLAKVFVV